MRNRLFCVAIILAAVGCSRQPNQPSAPATSGGGNAGVVQAAGNPVPDAPPVASGQASPEPPAGPKPSPAREARTAAEPPIVIPEGTRIHVRLAETVDTKHWRPGGHFRADLDLPVMVGGRVIVPRGTSFRGHVIEAKPSGRLKGRALLALTLDSFRMDGTTYPIRTAADLRASHSHKKRNLAFIGGGSGGGAAIGGIAAGGVGALIGAGAGAAAGTTTALITGRKQVTLPVETPMVFTLHSNVKVGG